MVTGCNLYPADSGYKFISPCDLLSCSTSALLYSLVVTVCSTSFNNKNPALCPMSAIMFLFSSCNAALTTWSSALLRKLKFVLTMNILYLLIQHSRILSMEAKYFPYDVQTSSSYKPKDLMHIQYIKFRIQRVEKICR